MKWNEIEQKIKTLEDLKKEKSKFFSPKGELFALISTLKKASTKEKVILGNKVKKIKEEAILFFNKIAKKITDKEINEKIKNNWIDVTIPYEGLGSLHPITKIINLIEDWFIQNGYFNHISSEIESDEYNFKKLNIPVDHPARDMHDTFYISRDHLLKTHNTSTTARIIKKMGYQKFSFFSISKVYRNDTDDFSHSHQFFQCDFAAVGNVSFSSLKWTINSLINYIFERKMKTRIRPSYFPFTEPSLELDVYFNGKWIEILAAGMLHKNVFKEAGIKKFQLGFAGALGIERIAMIKYKINDIRFLYENNVRLLWQFKGVK